MYASRVPRALYGAGVVARPRLCGRKRPLHTFACARRSPDFQIGWAYKTRGRWTGYEQAGGVVAGQCSPLVGSHAGAEATLRQRSRTLF
jgi:hypothetical protein